MKKTKWIEKNFDRNLIAEWSKRLGVSELILGILWTRGINTREEIETFLHKGTIIFPDPFLMKDMQKTVDRISQAIKNDELITVYGDYDVDGITATSLLNLFFSKLNIKSNYYIPNRHDEGYGLNKEALKTLSDGGTKVLITVDCGISAVEEVAKADPQMDIIITDHHNAPDILPPAFAIVNPKQNDCNYPMKNISGVGVAFKLCQALYKILCPEMPQPFTDFSEIVALGTVADIVELRGENRDLVRLGLSKINDSELLGVQELLKVCECWDKKNDTGTIGFRIAPHLNAVGRLSNAKLAVELLTTTHRAIAREIALTLGEENTQRKVIEQEILLQAEEQIARGGSLDNCILLVNENWNTGVIGIVASRLVDKYYLPSILISLSDGLGKASCRSIESLDLYKALNSCRDLFQQFGGHHQAAGFTIDAKNIPELKKRLQQYISDNLVAEDFYRKIRIDTSVQDTSSLNLQLIDELELLEPYGMGNPRPILSLENAKITMLNTFSNGQHLRIQLTKDDCFFDGVMWKHAYYANSLSVGAIVNIAFSPNRNIWQEHTKLQLNIIDIQQDFSCFDFRNNDNKLEMLNKCLTAKVNTLIYAHESQDLLQHFVSNYCQVVDYNFLMEAEHKVIIFYDLPILETWAEVCQRINDNKSNLEVFFVFTYKEIKLAILTMKKDALTDERLRKFYLSIKDKTSQEIDICREKLENIYVEFSGSSLCLDIFLEIGVIVEDDGKITFPNFAGKEKKSIKNSNIFRNHIDCFQKKLKFLEYLQSKSLTNILKEAY